MQRAAAELSLSESCFVVKLDSSVETELYSLRWFTPTKEVDLCGHGTLAAAHALWQAGAIRELVFETRSGRIRVWPAERRPPVAAEHDGASAAWPEAAMSCASFSFPANDPVSPLPPRETLEAITQALFGGEADITVLEMAFDSTTHKLLIEISSMAVLSSLAPDASSLLSINQTRCENHMRITGVVVTCVGEAPYHFCSRYFSPWNGIPYAYGEDPVNGSSHTLLAPFWARKLSAETFEACVLSPRGGRLSLSLKDDRVLISGVACTVANGSMLLR
jgi:predicted PhzF superfamily epimerase YddE/YHI9